MLYLVYNRKKVRESPIKGQVFIRFSFNTFLHHFSLLTATGQGQKRHRHQLSAHISVSSLGYIFGEMNVPNVMNNLIRLDTFHLLRETFIFSFTYRTTVSLAYF